MNHLNRGGSAISGITYTMTQEISLSRYGQRHSDITQVHAPLRNPAPAIPQGGYSGDANV